MGSSEEGQTALGAAIGGSDESRKGLFRPSVVRRAAEGKSRDPFLWTEQVRSDCRREKEGGTWVS